MHIHPGSLNDGYRLPVQKDQRRSNVAVAVDVEVDPGPDPGVAGARPPDHRHGDASVAARAGLQSASQRHDHLGGQHADRDAQVAYLNEQASVHLAAGDAAISVDTKKEELVAAYKDNGREWPPSPRPASATSSTTTPSKANRITRH
jgi:Rhodopirellula transposase DDE domain